MRFSLPVLGYLFSASFVLSQDLPLPVEGPAASRDSGQLLKPTLSIKPPSAKPAVVATPNATELAILETERLIVEAETRKQIAIAAMNGSATALKQLIVMNGPVDAAVSRAEKPPLGYEGRVSAVGMTGSEVMTKSVEQFFGAPMTPEREKALLDTVKTQLVGKDKPNVEVRLAGWWPNEGVMAVSVVTKG